MTSAQRMLPAPVTPAPQTPPVAPPAPVAPVHSWDLVTAEYGPGTRLVLFTAGCLLRCVYCDAPERWQPWSGRVVGVGEVMGIVHRYLPLFEVTGGGVSLSGGDPLLHPAFTAAVLRACRAEGVHTVLATSGALGRRLNDAALADIDLTLLDVKAYRPDTYHRLTRGEVAPALHFARRLARLGRPLQLRYVLVPGLTDDDDLEAFAEFVAGLGTVERVDVVPFRRREAAWHAMGMESPLATCPGPTREALHAAREVFLRRGVPVG